MSDNRFDAVEKEQLAAQVVALMNAHFHRPTAEEKRFILRLAADQLNEAEVRAAAAAPEGL